MAKAANKYSPEVRERAVRLVLDNPGQHESRWSAILSISSKIGCAPQRPNEWVKTAEVDRGERAGVTTETAEKLKALERETRELKQANEILRKGETIFRHRSEDTGRTLVLPRRSSTAGPGHDRFHRRSPWRPRGRADLQAAADCPVHLLRRSGQAGQP